MSTATRYDAIVIRTEGPEYVVTARGSASASPRQCVLAGKRFAIGRPVVGDQVLVGSAPDGESHDVILDVRPRTTLLERAASGGRRGRQALVANLDTLVVVAAAGEPPLRPGLIDRYIVVAEKQGMTPLLCFNKWDLAGAHDEAVREVYLALGYPHATTSSLDGRGLDALIALLRGHQSAFVGHSGVGKSSLMARIFPDHHFEVGALSQGSGRGRHTTTHASLLVLPGDGDSDCDAAGYVVDTPGIREFGLVDVEPEELATLYVDFAPFIERCRFSPCTHTHEPRCGVKAAVEAGELAPLRYENYVRLLEELREQPRW